VQIKEKEDVVRIGQNSHNYVNGPKKEALKKIPFSGDPTTKHL